jgi:hypothetical protein
LYLNIIKKIEFNNINSINITMTSIETDLSKLSKPELIEKCAQAGIIKCKSKSKFD